MAILRWATQHERVCSRRWSAFAAVLTVIVLGALSYAWTQGRPWDAEFRELQQKQAAQQAEIDGILIRMDALVTKQAEEHAVMSGLSSDLRSVLIRLGSPDGRRRP